MILPKIVQENFNIINDGYYYLDGQQISIKDKIQSAVDFTFYIPESLKIEYLKNTSSKTIIEIVPETTTSAGERLYKEGLKPVILNFASALEPGGGYLRGAKAQEEDLCRCSALYSCLEPQKQYYKNNKDTNSSLYTDGFISSKKVPFFRNDFHQLVEPYYLSVITCPAPNLNSSKININPNQLQFLLKNRARKFLYYLDSVGYKNIILGAWGCGAFGNSPVMISRIFHELLTSDLFDFDRVIFAIPDETSENYKTFHNRFIS